MKMENEDKPLSEKKIEIKVMHERRYDNGNLISKEIWKFFYPEKDVAEAVNNFEGDLITPNNKSKNYVEIDEIKKLIKKHFGSFEGQRHD